MVFKIGVFGIGVELEGLVNKQMYGETVYLNPIEVAQDMERKLHNEEHCDLIICLSHIGYEYKDNPNKVCDLKSGSTNIVYRFDYWRTYTHFLAKTYFGNQSPWKNNFSKPSRMLWYQFRAYWLLFEDEKLVKINLLALKFNKLKNI